MSNDVLLYSVLRDTSDVANFVFLISWKWITLQTIVYIYRKFHKCEILYWEENLFDYLDKKLLIVCHNWEFYQDVSMVWSETIILRILRKKYRDDVFQLAHGSQCSVPNSCHHTVQFTVLTILNHTENNVREEYWRFLFTWRIMWVKRIFDCTRRIMWVKRIFDCTRRIMWKGSIGDSYTC